MRLPVVSRLIIVISVIAVVILGSAMFSSWWKPEKPEKARVVQQTSDSPKLTKAQQALKQEHESKDWKKIPIKMGLWAAFLTISFIAMRKGRYNAKNRKYFYGAAIALFGVALGSDPSPMGTVKDAIALLAKQGVIFPPRIIALSLFLITVVLANKAICAWGCQLGTLQDLLFRLGRNKNDTKSLFPQFKIPFALSNSIRMGVFLLFVGLAFMAAYDFIGAIDPFKAFNPRVMTVAGVIVLSVVLISSLFTYRPWCHLACPFGLVGWLFEKLSWIKIRVNENTCTKCLACASACPSDAMEAIVLKKRNLPDCFSCGTCLDACPSKSISFSTKKEFEQIKQKRK